MDAESETLVNQALHRMLEGSNTTISIAHRLSTIQRSDSIIVIGSDGKVAQMGGFGELSADKGGAFAKLMVSLTSLANYDRQYEILGCMG